MAIKQVISKLASDVLKMTSKDTIVGKDFTDFPIKLYYERSQHITFFLKNKISYEPIIQGRLKRYIKEGDTVFDIGSNIGQYALVFSYLTGPRGRVIAFEPDSKNFSFLQFNVNINNCSNIIVNKKGVSSSSTIQTFFRDSTTGGRRGSFIKEYVDDTFTGQVEEVQSVTYNEIVRDFGHADFVKIDVEGFESEVIKGINESYGTNTMFLIEVRKETGPDIFNFFIDKNFSCFCIDTTEDVVITEASNLPSFANLLFIPASRQ